jgi:hypothetical protein
VVPFNEPSYDKTLIIRDATEMVVRLTKHGQERHDEISRVVFRLADQVTYSATALANLTLIEMAEAALKTG